MKDLAAVFEFFQIGGILPCALRDRLPRENLVTRVSDSNGVYNVTDLEKRAINRSTESDGRPASLVMEMPSRLPGRLDALLEHLDGFRKSP